MRCFPNVWPGILLWALVGLCFVLTGCAPLAGEVLPTAKGPGLTSASTSPASASQTPTLTPSLVPSLTPLPSPSPTAAPTQTPSPTQTAIPTQTATPTPTDTPSPTQTPTAAPSPSPTVPPDAQLSTARRHLTNGEYASAIAALEDLLANRAGPDLAREAAYMLAEVHYLNRGYEEASGLWQEFVTAYPDDARLFSATLMLARSFDLSGECAAAVANYQEYLERQAILADLASEWLGDCYASAGNLPEAIDAYSQALAASPHADTRLDIRQKMAEVYLVGGGLDAALTEYDTILEAAQDGGRRAEIEYLAGQALVDAGKHEAAYGRFQRVMDNDPKAEVAYFALGALVDAGIPVDEFQRGMINYYAGDDYAAGHGDAVLAFDRYLALGVPEHAAKALFYKANALESMDQAQAARETFDQVIGGGFEEEWRIKAWRNKGALLSSMGAKGEAVQVYQEIAAAFPTVDVAPNVLWQAAEVRVGEGAFAEAAQLFQQVQQEYPEHKKATEALWRAGLSLYRAGDIHGAVSDWQALLAAYPNSSYKSKTRYWLGKVGGGPAGESAYWDMLVADQPGRYYALRVEQVRTGATLTATRLITDTVEAPEWDVALAEAEILSWLQSWTDLAQGTALLPLPEALAQDFRLARGQALLAIGHRRAALDTLDRVRASSWKDPLSLAQLALYFREQGWHGLAAHSALRLAGLWPGGTIHDAPVALRMLAYPLAYADLLSAEAQARDLDPLLLAALVRQESLFEPVAESYAGARGLGQVMPATGTGIAKVLKVEDFSLDFLYRPAISVRFGAFYVDVQMGRFDDQILVALAAYNGGPGNTLRWLEEGGDDFDLFVEVITANQSRHYLQTVYEQYLIYEALYRPEQGERVP